MYTFYEEIDFCQIGEIFDCFYYADQKKHELRKAQLLRFRSPKLLKIIYILQNRVFLYIYFLGLSAPSSFVSSR